MHTQLQFQQLHNGEAIEEEALLHLSGLLPEYKKQSLQI
jgi:hypothetical protein